MLLLILFIRSGLDERKYKRPSLFNEDDKDKLRAIVYDFHQRFKHPKSHQLLLEFKRLHRDPEWQCSTRSFRKFLRSAKFSFGKTKFGKTRIAESARIQDLCYSYLLKYNEYKNQQRKFYYQDETFSYTSEYRGFSWSNNHEECLHQLNSSSQGAMLIIAHVGSSTGWVKDHEGKDCAFVMKSDKPFADYHKNMNAHNFELWMSRKIIPNLENHSVLVMDNCAFHKVIPNKKPGKSARNKKVFVDFIITNTSEYDEGQRETLQRLTRKQLQDIVNGIEIDQSMAIERIIRASGKDIKILFMPPYHSVFNPIELQWSQLKRHVRENNYEQTEESVINLVQEGIVKTNSMWPNQISHTEKIQTKELERFEEINVPHEFIDNIVELPDSDDDGMEAHDVESNSETESASEDSETESASE